MSLQLTRIDHIHVNVANRGKAAEWYRKVLGLRRVKSLDAWATKNGPLTIESSNGHVHLALFDSDDHAPTTAVAFGASAKEFLTWKAQLEQFGLVLRLADHGLAYSLYFEDPWQNGYEITTYERDSVAKALRGGSH